MTTRRVPPMFIRVFIFSVFGISLTWLFIRSSFSWQHVITTIAIFLVFNVFFEIFKWFLRNKDVELPRS